MTMSKFTPVKTFYKPTYIIPHSRTIHQSFIEYDSSDSEAEEDPITDLTKLKLSHNEVINKTTFRDESFIPPTSCFWDSVVDDNANEDPLENDNTMPLNQRFREQTRFTFATILDIIQGAIGGFMKYETFVNNEDTNEEEDETTPTIAGIAKQLARKHNKTLDKKQYITYEIICCSFLLTLLNDATSPSSELYRHIDRANNNDTGRKYSVKLYQPCTSVTNQQCLHFSFSRTTQRRRLPKRGEKTS